MYQIGYRFWEIDQQGDLYSPFEKQQKWQENNRFTQSKGIGIHAWKHVNQKIFCNYSYFNPQTASLHNSKGSNKIRGEYYIVGTIIGKYPKPSKADEIIVDQALPAALSLPLDTDFELQRRAELASQKYQVELVIPQSLYETSQEKLQYFL